MLNSPAAMADGRARTSMVMGGCLRRRRACNNAVRAARRAVACPPIADIQKDIEVVGWDGKHVGAVDHLKTADRIILSKNDPIAGGRHHLISIDWVDYVDRKVHLNKPSTKATPERHGAA
jgi:hypothetical protein